MATCVLETRGLVKRFGRGANAQTAVDLMRGLSRVLGLLRPLGVASARLGLLAMLAVSAIPLALATYVQARDAVAARGLSGPRALVATAVPLLVMSVKRADELSEALDARGV